MPRHTLEILWQSDRLVAVLKPAGLATIPGRAETTSVLEELAAQLNLPCIGTADPRIRVVHRLDKETSGVLLFAKDRDAQRHLSHQFQNNTIHKEYVAICAGHPEHREGEIDLPLCASPASPERMIISEAHGRPARTLYKVEESFGEYHYVRAFPKTGKTHQIRVHLKAVGLPLAVDPLYNRPAPGSRKPHADAVPGLYLSAFKRGYRPTAGEEERPLIDRLTLHAEKLKFANVAGEEVEIVAALPKDFRATLNQLRRHGRR